VRLVAILRQVARRNCRKSFVDGATLQDGNFSTFLRSGWWVVGSGWEGPGGSLVALGRVLPCELIAWVAESGCERADADTRGPPPIRGRLRASESRVETGLRHCSATCERHAHERAFAVSTQRPPLSGTSCRLEYAAQFALPGNKPPVGPGAKSIGDVKSGEAPIATNRHSNPLNDRIGGRAKKGM
jgi:hypothetical protein